MINEFLFPEKLTSIDKLIDRNYKLVFTNGCFDILHSGHIKSLKFCKSLGDKLVVALNSDKSIKLIKGKNRPIVPELHRINVLSALQMVDFVLVFDDENPSEIIKTIRPDILVKGEDYKNKYVSGSEYAKQVIFAPFYQGISTTLLIEKMNNKI